MAVVVTLIVGFLVGAVARLHEPGRDAGSTILSPTLGMSGAILAGILGELAGWYRIGEPQALLAGVAGALLVLLGFEALRRGPRAVRR
jgi:uncharacterized membrane protein YeaQ/YmgE (transglycosylase-associated protein family)